MNVVSAHETITATGPPPATMTRYAAIGMASARTIFSTQTCTFIVPKPRLPSTSTEYAAEKGRNGVSRRMRSAMSFVSSPPLNSRARPAAQYQRMMENRMPSRSTGTTAAMTVGRMRSSRPSARSRLIIRTSPVLPPSSANRLITVNTAITTMTEPAFVAPSSRVSTTRSRKLATP